MYVITDAVVVCGQLFARVIGISDTLSDIGNDMLHPGVAISRVDEETKAPGIVPGDFWAEVTSEAESQLGPEATELL